MKRHLQIVAVCLACVAGMSGQTTIHLSTQARNVDFTNAEKTKPAKAGTVLPAACEVGEVFFKTNAPAGENLYGCVASDGWTLLGDGGAGATSSLPDTAGQAHRLLSNDGAGADWRLVGPGLLIDSMQLAVDTAAVPMLGAANTFRSSNTFTGPVNVAGGGSFVDFTGAARTRPVQTGSTPPVVCHAGEEMFLDTSSARLLICNSNGDGWIGAGGGVALELAVGDGVNVIETGVAGYIEAPDDCTISRWTVLADQPGSIEIDVWKGTYDSFPPTALDSITASAPISLSSAQKSRDTAITGWNAVVNAGDILALNVDSVSAVTRVTVALRCER